MEVKEAPDIKFQLNGTSTGGTGPDLTKYPNLCHAPLQWGDHVACHSNGADVARVAAAAAERPIEYVCHIYGISIGEASDALRYARDNRMI